VFVCVCQSVCVRVCVSVCVCESSFLCYVHVLHGFSIVQAFDEK